MKKVQTILLVEDDEFKSRDIQRLIANNYPNAIVTSVGDVANAISKIQSFEFNLIVLDIALPSRRARAGAGSTSSLLSGGIEIIYRLEAAERDDPVLIVTQYPDVEVEEGEFISTKTLSKSSKDHFEANIVGCVHYDRKNKFTWTKPILSAMKKVL